MTQIASVYAQGLYSLAKEENLDESILAQLTVLQESIRENPEFLKLLSLHDLSKTERCAILDSSFQGKLQPYLLNFLKLLTEKGYIRHFSDCCDAYRSLYNEDHGILVVKVTSALELHQGQKQRLSEKLCALTGKTVVLNCRIDPDVLGGLRLDYDGIRLDDTLCHRLDAAGAMLKNTVL